MTNITVGHRGMAIQHLNSPTTLARQFLAVITLPLLLPIAHSSYAMTAVSEHASALPSAIVLFVLCAHAEETQMPAK